MEIIELALLTFVDKGLTFTCVFLGKEQWPLNSKLPVAVEFIEPVLFPESNNCKMIELLS